MTLALRKPLTFLTRDFIDDTSYRLSFALRFTNIIFFAFVFFFLSRLIGDSAAPHLNRYGGDYFSFALIGIGFTRFFSAIIVSLRAFIRDSQLNGTLEALLSTQTGALTIIFSAMLYPLVFTGIELLVLFMVGFLLFDLNIFWLNFPTAMVVLALSLVSFASLGLVSAGFIIMFKRGDPVAKLLTLATQILSGELYPVSVLPVWLQFASVLLPVTHALEGVRLSLLQNYSLVQLAPQLSALLIFDIILLPVSIIFFDKAIRRAKIDGSLAQF